MEFCKIKEKEKKRKRNRTDEIVVIDRVVNQALK